MKPDDHPADPVSFKNETITEADFKTFLDSLAHGECYDGACEFAGHSNHGMRGYVRRAEERGQRLMRARAKWRRVHLDRLNRTDDDGSGSSSRVRASLGALASVDKRFRKEVHVGGTQIHNTLVLADPRPSGLIGNPDRYAISQEPAPADAQVIEPPAAKEQPPTPPLPPASAKKPRPIL